MHRVALLVVLCSLCVVNIASAQTVTGNMDATMKRGDTQTLTATLDFSNRSYSGHLIVLVTAGRDLTLGKTTISTPFNCLETPNFNDCEADVSITAGQKITMTQVLTVRDDAFHSSASWTIELIGDGLSGAVPRTGVITIPDGGPKIVVSRAASGILLVKPVAADQNADSFDLTNIGTSPGFVS